MKKQVLLIVGFMVVTKSFCGFVPRVSVPTYEVKKIKTSSNLNNGKILCTQCSSICKKNNLSVYKDSNGNVQCGKDYCTCRTKWHLR